MAFELETHGQKVEYVYPFICGLCGYSSSNIDLFHHHFETHGDTVPSSVFHLCELENMRSDGSESCINVGSFSCKACSHTFPTVCNLVEHLDKDPNTQQYIMDLKSKVAYPLTKAYAQVYTHNFPAKSKQKKKQATKKTKNQSRGGKSGPKQRSQAQGSFSFDQPFFGAESKQKRAGDVFNTVNALDFYDNDDDDNSGEEPNVDNSNSMIGSSEGKNGVKQEKKSWLSCKYCGLSVSKRKLKAHEKEHLTYEGNLKFSQENMCRCEQCDYVMLKESSARHICELLKPLTARRSRAKRGEPKKGLDQTLTPCPNCNRLFKRYFLMSHIKNMHQEHEPVPCDICGKVFRHKASMRTHRRLHEPEKKFPCNQCPHKCRTRTKLRLHLRRHRPERDYACDQCPSRFKSTSELRRHEKIHIKSTDRIRYQCELCPKSYDYKDGLAQHHRRLHTGDNTIASASGTGTEAPETVQPPKKDKPHKCDQCLKSFWTPSLLENHINTHRGVMPFVCNECPNKYYTSHSLKRHKLWKHTERNRIFKCEKCPKSFILPVSLKKHVQISHKPGDERLICGFRTCRHKFEKQEELDKHRSQYHTDEMERICTLCEKSYMNIEGLTQHMRVKHRVKKTRSDKPPRRTPHKLLIEKDGVAAHDHAYTLSLLGSPETICDLVTEVAEETIECGETCEVDTAPATGDTTDMQLSDDPDEVLVATQLIAEELDADVPDGGGIDAYVCHNCQLPEIFTTLDAFQQHVQMKHSPSYYNEFVCGWKTCRVVFNNQKDLDKHRNIHKRSSIVQEKIPAATNTNVSIAVNEANKSPRLHNIPSGRADTPKSGRISGEQTVKTSTHGTQTGKQGKTSTHGTRTGKQGIANNVVTAVNQVSQKIGTQPASRRIVLRKSVSREVPKGTGDGTQSIKSHSLPRVLLIKNVLSKAVNASAIRTAVDSVVDADITAKVKTSVPLTVTKTSVPMTTTSVPLAKTSVPLANTSVPLAKTSVPLRKTSVPITKTSVPLTKTSVPMTKTSVPLTKTSVCLIKTSVPMTKTSVPMTKTSVHMTKTSVPMTKMSVPLTKTSVPMTKTSVPMTKMSVPLTKTSVPLTKSSVPLTKTSASSSRNTRSATERAQNAVKVDGNQSFRKHSLYNVNAEGVQSGKTKVILIRTGMKRPLKE